MPRSREWILVCTGLIASAAAMAQAPAKSDSPPAKEGVAAYLGDQPITTQELDARALKMNMKLAQSMYDARKQALDQVILERVLGPEAATKNVKVDDLIREKVAANVKPVTDAEVNAFFQANAGRYAGKTVEQVGGQIRIQLAQQREKQERDKLIDEVKSKAGVRVTLEPPRADVAIAANDPVQGPASAKVTIVEFSEFE